MSDVWFGTESGYDGRFQGKVEAFSRDATGIVGALGRAGAAASDSLLHVLDIQGATLAVFEQTHQLAFEVIEVAETEKREKSEQPVTPNVTPAENRLG